MVLGLNVTGPNITLTECNFFEHNADQT